MFKEESVFEEWLDKRATEVFGKMGTGEPIGPEDMNILVLKGQTNHFVHLDRELRGEMKALREDMDKRFEAVNKRFAEMREDMDKRFEAVDRRFEAVDRRFAEMRKDMDKRFAEMREDMDKRFTSTQWLIGTGIALLAAMIAAFQFLQ